MNDLFFSENIELNLILIREVFNVKKGIFSKVLFIALGAIMMLSLGACASNEKEKSKDSKEVVVGLDNTFVPMGFLDEQNELIGFDIDLAKEAFKRAGYEPQFENIDWSMKEQSLNNGTVDCLWNGYSITDERRKKVAFSKPYLDNKQIAITMPEEPFKNIEDLKNQVVGTQAASSALEAIEKDKEFLANIKNKEPITYDTYDKALRDLEIGRTQAVIGDEVLLKYYIKQRNPEKYKVLEGDLGTEKYAVGFRVDDIKLREAIDKALDEIKEDGTFQQLEEKWFQ